MQCHVTLLRRAGQRLKPAELAEPVLGDLEVGAAHDSNNFRRGMLVARLRSPDGVQQTPRDLLVPLHDARLLAIDGQTLTLIGIELHPKHHDGDLRITEYVQIWRCTLDASG